MEQSAVDFISEDEYLAQERASEEKYEYYDGEIFAMAGASEKHNLIVTNVISELRYQLKKRPCRVYPSDMRLKIEATGLYTYPDVMVVCGEREFGDENLDTLLNPDVIIEVLSDSTESYDRGAKFRNYRDLKSLNIYIMISQNSRRMEMYVRKADGSWRFTEADDDRPLIILESIGCELKLEEVYDKTDDS
jgi:Uma2 family endonuclease